MSTDEDLKPSAAALGESLHQLASDIAEVIQVSLTSMLDWLADRIGGDR